MVGQVLIRKQGGGFELRHSDDAQCLDGDLAEYRLDGLRRFADFASDGRFRPLKAAPNLRRGWRLRVGTPQELALALDRLYPGLIPDWYASRQGRPFVTNFRAFTARQSGMYRATQQLSDRQAAVAIRACCHRRHCLKHRLWGLEGQKLDETDEEKETSEIPCLEPCAIMLEFARTAIRLEQTERRELEVTGEEIAALRNALVDALSVGDPSIRYGDFNAPGNPRRLELELQKLRSEGVEMEGGVKQLSLGAKEVATFRYALERTAAPTKSGTVERGPVSASELLLEKIDRLFDSGGEAEEKTG